MNSTPVDLSDIIDEENMTSARARLDEKEKTPEWVKDLMEMRAQQQARAQENDKA